MLFRIAVPVNSDPVKPKDKFKTVPEIVTEAVPVTVSVTVTAQLALASRVWMPAALTGPEKVFPDCVSVMEN